MFLRGYVGCFCCQAGKMGMRKGLIKFKEQYNIMKRFKPLVIAFFLALTTSLARADEGMWLPFLLEKLNEKQMKSLGMKISARDIYSINNGSLFY